jgi:hypothetical protein
MKPEAELLRQSVGATVEAVAYLVSDDERGASFSSELIHVVREIRIKLREMGNVYFTWCEEPALNGHPFVLRLSLSSAYDSASDLEWLDMSSEVHWQPIVAEAIVAAQIFEEESAYSGAEPSARVTTGMQLNVRGAFVQITVIQPPLEYRIVSLADPRWMPNSSVSAVFPPIDLRLRPDVKIQSIESASAQ